MKNQERSTVKLNPEIVDLFEKDTDLLLVKGGGVIGSIWEKVCDSINIVNCKCEVNHGNCRC